MEYPKIVKIDEEYEVENPKKTQKTVEADDTEHESDYEAANEMRFIQFLQNLPEVQELIREYCKYEKEVADNMMREDFEKIKEAYPEVKASCVADLGEEYCKLVAMQYDPVVAYEAVRAKALRETKNPPPYIGAVNNTDGEEKDYYSPEEVDKLTREDFRKNPRLLDVVQRSMLKWAE